MTELIQVTLEEAKEQLSQLAERAAGGQRSDYPER